MKTTLIIVLVSIIAAMSYFMIMMYITIDALTDHTRFSYEYEKACEGRTMYLENTLKNAGIEVVQ